MKYGKSAYIKINDDENSVISSGISFKDFYLGISNKPKNLLILRGYPYNTNFHRELNLEYIVENGIQDLVDENIYDYGDFHWVDFKDYDS